MTSPVPPLGSISWADLTVPDARPLAEFYGAVAGWRIQPVGMGEYDDYCMVPATGVTPSAGICHARGPNADLPPTWLVYITVADLDRALAAVVAHGGTVVKPAVAMGGTARYAIFRDPVGAHAALYQA